MTDEAEIIAIEEDGEAYCEDGCGGDLLTPKELADFLEYEVAGVRGACEAMTVRDGDEPIVLFGTQKGLIKVTFEWCKDYLK